MFQNVKEKKNNYFINPSQESCFVYDKSERLINKSCNLYQILGEIIGILRNACTLSTENRHKTLHGFDIMVCCEKFRLHILRKTTRTYLAPKNDLFD